MKLFGELDFFGKLSLNNLGRTRCYVESNVVRIRHARNIVRNFKLSLLIIA